MTTTTLWIQNYSLIKILCPVVLGLTFAVAASAVGSDSHGLGDHIEWHPLEEGLELAKESNKPLMLIIHKSWCGACKALKPKFEESKEIAELSKKFVMVNTLDDEEPEGDAYTPDGGYIPRLLFFEPNGELLSDIVNEGGNPKYKFYYHDAETVAKSMSKVVKLYNPEESGDTAENVEKEAPVVETKNETNRVEL